MAARTPRRPRQGAAQSAIAAYLRQLRRNSDADAVGADIRESLDDHERFLRESWPTSARPRSARAARDRELALRERWLLAQIRAATADRWLKVVLRPLAVLAGLVAAWRLGF